MVWKLAWKLCEGHEQRLDKLLIQPYADLNKVLESQQLPISHAVAHLSLRIIHLKPLVLLYFLEFGIALNLLK